MTRRHSNNTTAPGRERDIPIRSSHPNAINPSSHEASISKNIQEVFTDEKHRPRLGFASQHLSILAFKPFQPRLQTQPVLARQRKANRRKPKNEYSRCSTDARKDTTTQTHPPNASLKWPLRATGTETDRDNRLLTAMSWEVLTCPRVPSLRHQKGTLPRRCQVQECQAPFLAAPTSR